MAIEQVTEEIEITTENREEVIKQYSPMIKYVANRIAMRLPPHIEVDDLISVGVLGLIDAITKYDPTRGAKFKTYAEFRVRGAILDELRSMDWVPRSVRAATNEWGKAWRSQTFEYGREPSDQEMADHLEMNLEEYHEFILKASPTPLISIEEFNVHSNQEDSVSLLEILAKPGEKDPFVLLSMQQMKSKLADAVAELEEREQLVLSLYYQEEMNLKEIGEILGVIESRVSQIRTKTILKLRAKLRLMTRDGMED